MVRIRRFSVVKTATVVALMYMVIVAVFAIPFFLLFAVTGVSVNGSAATSASKSIPSCSDGKGMSAQAPRRSSDPP